MTIKNSLLAAIGWVTLLTACGSSGNRFRLEGEFKNMNQAELYLYNAADGRKDTIHVQRGRFIYETDLKDTATLMVMFPNYSQIPVFATSGITAKMKGDASQLREIKVKGSKQNDEMTAFRLKANQLAPPEMTEIAAEYITEEPNSPVSFYLLQQYFVKALEPDYRRAMLLCNTMLQANPQNRAVLQLKHDLRPLTAGSKGSRMPVFALLDTKGRVVTNRQMQKKVNVVCLWATWNYESRAQLSTLRKLVKENPGKISALGISIDATAGEGRDWTRRDSVNFPLVCDGKMWQTPMAQALGMNDLPTNIVTDEKGIIVERDIPNKEMQKRLQELMK